ncbi:hypothetical protein AKJ62_03225 [candidate division MSBL1 archaeon SCGC-AAA259D14]|uniref:Radical SAM core domain-containing protein n=2 Tax=candidate division MSBL1 TaxID=215777 RepID=A0A133U5D3_9EURY|nr:hypothetical protein AKJ62_03225 [candidate division MSBL1 archaeon SCGC-AAA259D14]KXA92482.1 hypothetical protein AKJ66_04085 [candidate division MSBL1 archaeon SCGC-AAA259E22]
MADGISSFFRQKNESPESLQRYYSVMKGENPTRFRICKKTPVEVGLDSGERELWREHEDALDKFRDLLKKIDEKKLKLEDVDVPKTSLLDLKIELAKRILESCHFCERRCGVDRSEGETGACGVGVKPRVSSEFLHMGEEPELVPSYTIFFSGCTFNCQFCQNWDISQNPDSGMEYSSEEISSLISQRRQSGARNVNWVGGDPTPNLHFILSVLNGCEVNIPSVWNSNMYLSEEGMRLLAGTQDVYLTDFKYGNDECASKYSKVQSYWDIITRNHRLAFEDAELIIRHLVLPEHLKCCTSNILKWIRKELGQDVRVNIMGQYRPQAKARNYPELSRRVNSEEMNEAFRIAKEVGLTNIV